MCILEESYIRIAVRIGADKKPPIVANGNIPIGMFFYCGAGSKYVQLTYRIEIYHGNAEFKGIGALASGVLRAGGGSFYAPSDPNHGLRTSDEDRQGRWNLHVIAPKDHYRGIVKFKVEARFEPLPNEWEPLSDYDRRWFVGVREADLWAEFA